MPSHLQYNFSNSAATFQRCNLAIIQDDACAHCPAILVASPNQITADAVNNLLGLSQGLTFVAITPDRAAALNLEPMTSRSPPQSGHQLPEREMCVSVEAREGVTTGISAADRAVTIRALTEDPPVTRRLVKPGHVFPIIVRLGGVLVKHALAEAARDFVRIVSECDSALFVDLLDARGEQMEREAQLKLGTKHNIPILTISALVRHRLEHEQLVERVSESTLDSPIAGQMRCITYCSPLHRTEQIALVKGDIDPNSPILTRVQPARTFSDVFAPDASPHRSQIHASLRAIAKRGQGVLVYLERLNSQSPGSTPLPTSMMREYGIGAQVLRDLGVRHVDLLTGTQRNLAGLKTFGIDIVSQTALSEATLERRA